MRHIIQGYLSPKGHRILDYDELHRLILHCAHILNSTPLGDVPDSHNDPHSITTHHILTQRGDACNETYARCIIYLSEELMACES